ncbi:MAG: conserved membrane protein of unknown function [Promethearchaeota archaeon]|nr:MAG: conserved membrane protein of unknown function [Candidatus Lokiarchaeota archaeon]
MMNRYFNRKTILILSFLSLFIIGTIFMFITPFSIKSSYYLTTQTSDGETISFNVFEPVQSEDPKKAVLIGHGFMANKEFMKGYAIELAAAGFVAVPFDFRGHGMSTGSLDRGNLILDVQAIINYLNTTRSDIDMDNLAYIGYSMGGGPGNQIVNESLNFKAFIGVGTGLGNIRSGDSSNPLNVLMIYAKFDEAFQLSSLVDSVATRVGVSTAAIDTNQLYGSFDNGNATQIYLDDNSNHLAVAWDTDFTREARDWIINTFPETNTPDENFYGNLRLLLLIIQIIGGIGLFIMLIDPISTLLKHKQENSEERLKIEIRDTSAGKLSITSLLYSIPLSIVGIFIIIWIFIPLPLAIEGFFLSLLFGQVFGILVLLWRLAKKNDLSLKQILKTPFTRQINDLGKSIIYGFVLITILYLILYSSIGLNYIGMVPSITKAWAVAIFIIITFLMFIIFGIFFQFIIRPMIPWTKKGTLKAILIHFGILLSYMTFFLLFLGFLTGSFFFFGTTMPVAICLNLMIAGVSVYTYEKTGNIIAGTLIAAILFVMIVSTLAPYQGFLGFLSGFL